MAARIDLDSTIAALSTAMGSGSIAIACHDYGFDLVACEIDTDYYNSAVKRFNNHKAQTFLNFKEI